MSPKPMDVWSPTMRVVSLKSWKRGIAPLSNWPYAVNAGVYRADAALLFSVLSEYQDNAQGEYYLTDLVAGALNRRSASPRRSSRG